MDAERWITGVPSAWEDRVRDLIPDPVLYERDWMSGERAGRCTRCGHLFSDGRKRIEWPDDPDVKFRRAVHNDRIACPGCGAEARMKAKGRFPTNEMKSLAGHLRAVFAQKITPQHVRLRAFYIEYTFRQDAVFPDLDFFEDFALDLEPGKAHGWRKVAGTRDNWESCGIREPWNSRDALNPYKDMSYTLIGDDLAGTFLGWVPIEAMARWDWTHYTSFGNPVCNTPWCKVLGWAAVYPSLEMVAKLGGCELIFDLVFEGKKNARYVNWRARRITDFLRIPREYAKPAARDGLDLDVIKMIRDLGYDFGKAKRRRDLGWDPERIKKEGEEVVRYLERQGLGAHDLHLLRDYREAAEFLGRDLTVPGIRWPRDLRRAHDEATQSADRIREEKRRQKDEAARRGYAERIPALKARFEYEAGDYMAVVPEQLSDIALEGRLQRHCVGGYAGRHAAGVLTIIFIRRVMAPMIPLWTVELTPEGEMRQIQGYHNEAENRPQGADAAWVENWLRVVQERIRKEERKQKNG